MPYVTRNEDGEVIAEYGSQQEEGQEFAEEGSYIMYEPPVAAPVNPVDKLKAFLSSNPDVAALL